MKNQVFKIRCKANGLFSTGGCDPKFNRVGKAWSTRGALNGHLTLVRDGLTSRKSTNRLATIYHDCDVVIFNESGHYPAV